MGDGRWRKGVNLLCRPPSFEARLTAVSSSAIEETEDMLLRGEQGTYFDGFTSVGSMLSAPAPLKILCGPVSALTLSTAPVAARTATPNAELRRTFAFVVRIPSVALVCCIASEEGVVEVSSANTLLVSRKDEVLARTLRRRGEVERPMKGSQPARRVEMSR